MISNESDSCFSFLFLERIIDYLLLPILNNQTSRFQQIRLSLHADFIYAALLVCRNSISNFRILDNRF